MMAKLKPVGLVLLFVVLLALPLLARWGYYYRGIYAAPEVPRPDLEAVDVPTVAAIPFADTDVQQSKGYIVIDRGHDNAVEDAELGVLLARLTARGAQTAFSHDSLLGSSGGLSDLLRKAAALVVISPHKPFSPEEAEAVVRFVELGGRVVLIGDPSRYALVQKVDELQGEMIVPQSDVAALNSLATPFGLAFADDYLYDTAENAGNYQYVIFNDFGPEGDQNPLTAGLGEVVFYAAHSISAGETALITAGPHTTSSSSEQSGGLSAMSLGGDGRVLAIGDFTFMTEPYNSTGDNDRLIARVADFVAGAQRTYGLADFPGFFGDDVDMVALIDPSAGEALEPAAIGQAARLQYALVQAGKRLHWRTRPAPGHDTLYLGLYGGLRFWPDVSELLASQGISFTLETVERALATPTATPRTPVSEGQATGPTPSTPAASPTPLPTVRPPRDWIHFAGLGQVDATQMALFYQNEQGDSQTLIVLAFSEDGLASALERLSGGDYADCLMDQDLVRDPGLATVALCPIAYQSPSLTPTPVPGTEGGIDVTATPALGGDLLVVSDDNGEGTYDWWTSAYDLAAIAEDAGYKVTLWSTSMDGDVTLEQMQSYQGIIWCTGDYREEGTTPAEDDLSNLATYLDQGGKLILSGAFIGSSETSESGLLLDVQVQQGDHPLTEGFQADQVIVLQHFTADEDYMTYVLSDSGPASVVFVRGPSSEFAGASALTVSENNETGSRAAWIGFPIYLLPYEDGFKLANNAVRWLMAE